ncbi:hypothetical protein JTB14_010390 [Gonioctena quinquepunctata]|nr:hypothetical protein JTB14_010390 [Gonioctena quinquepunctata]
MTIQAWMNDNYLKLAPHKTEKVILEGPRSQEGIRFTVDNVEVTPKKVVKYLGIWIDNELSLHEHIRRTAKRAEEIQERTGIFGVEKEQLESAKFRVRTRSITICQLRWDTTGDVAKWTKELIPDIKKWKDCKHKRLLTKGVFNVKRLTVLLIRYWPVTERNRHQFGPEFGQDTGVHNVVTSMMVGKKKCEKIHSCIKSIMKSKEEEESVLRQA